MNPFVKILAWIAMVVLGWHGLKFLLGTVFGLVAVMGKLIFLAFNFAILAVIAYAIMYLYKRVRSESH